MWNHQWAKQYSRSEIKKMWRDNEFSQVCHHQTTWIDYVIFGVTLIVIFILL